LKKFGLKLFLTDFVKTVTKLRTTGIDININGVNNLIWGTLLVAICDTPAAGFLGGFKESPLFARKGCRTCTASTFEMRNCFQTDFFQERNGEIHIERCKELMDMDKKKDQIKKVYWSKMWGINAYSPLLDIPGVNLSQILLHDGMHCLQEGILPETIALLLQYGIANKIFSLAWLNSELKGFNYSYLDTDNRPECIMRKHVFESVHLKQTAVEMITCTYLLPLILYSKAEELGEYYRNFIQLAGIALLCNSPYSDMDTAGDLQILIEMYLNGFKKLYPTLQMRCKCHFLCHFPVQCLRFGAMKHMNLFRFESKNNFFKQKSWKNFINLPLSLAKHHQLFDCYYGLDITGEENENFLYSGDLVRDGTILMFDERYPDLVEEMQVNVMMNEQQYDNSDIEVYSTPEIVLNGLKYRQFVCLLLGWENRFPSFGEIEQIFVYKGTKFAVCRIFYTVCFEWKANAYEVELSLLRKLVVFEKLKNNWPLPQYSICGKTFITNRHAHFSGGMV
jgi:hypothetical protein